MSTHHYYPFGMEWDTPNFDVNGNSLTGSGVKTKYTYNGNENVKDLDINLMDFNARWYEPAIGRFTTVDPLADKVPGWTPFRFGFNNPFRYNDPLGMLESTHLDEDGNVIAEFEDGDDSVYQHSNGTSKGDIQSHNYYASANTGNIVTDGGGTQIAGVEATVTAPRTIEEVTQIGVTGTVIIGVGITLSAGYIEDENENNGFYGEIGIGWGYDVSIGGESITHVSTKTDGKLSLSDIEGQGVMNNVGVNLVDISWGGNDDSNMNFAKDYGGKYTSHGGGFSLSHTRFSFTQTIGWTGIKQRKTKNLP